MLLCFYLGVLAVVGSSKHVSRRVIGGHEISGFHSPGDVSLRRVVGENPHTHLCGGVLIRPDWVLTAAHCLTGSRVHEWEVIVGGRERLLPNKMILRQYDKFSGRNDLAMLRLQQPSRFGHVAALVNNDYIAAGNCTVVGYGMTGPRDTILSSTLREAQVEVVATGRCQAALGNYQHLPEDSVCAGGGDADTCQGDSGSPLLCAESQSDAASGSAHDQLVAGIVSSGFSACATRGVPGVYTNVAWHRPWLDWVLSS